ncbi:unnamed protein product, partial [Ectocarpus sp. 6 AP-2014]
ILLREGKAGVCGAKDPVWGVDAIEGGQRSVDKDTKTGEPSA